VRIREAESNPPGAFSSRPFKACSAAAFAEIRPRHSSWDGRPIAAGRLNPDPGKPTASGKNPERLPCCVLDSPECSSRRRPAGPPCRVPPMCRPLRPVGVLRRTAIRGRPLARHGADQPGSAVATTFPLADDCDRTGDTPSIAERATAFHSAKPAEHPPSPPHHRNPDALPRLPPMVLLLTSNRAEDSCGPQPFRRINPSDEIHATRAEPNAARAIWRNSSLERRPRAVTGRRTADLGPTLVGRPSGRSRKVGAVSLACRRERC